MSNNYWDDEDDNDDVITGNESEDALQKKLRKKIRADEKRIKELEEKLGQYDKVNNERTVKEILEKQGVNSKAARLIMKDLETFSEESVNSWLEENGDLFGFEKQATEASSVSEEARQALRQQDQLTEGAITPDRMQDLESRIANAADEGELRRIMYSSNS